MKAPTASKWTHDPKYQVWEIWGKGCKIWIAPRPHYCDRGNWLAHLDAKDPDFAREVDWQDGWPRYFMDLDRAKLEIEDWLKKRGQWMP